MASGQEPMAVVITCADSRVPPEIIFDQGLGDLFVVRVAGNIVDDAVTGSVEFAVENLEVPLVVVMGHSFGGAVAIRAAVVMTASVAGVVTFATQSAGCEVAGALGGRPLLLFHGDRDEILPSEASLMVQAIAGHGDVEMLPGDGHLLAKSDDVIAERLQAWLPEVLGI